MKRGIIASALKSERISVSGVEFTSNISLQDLNYYLLYWDKVVFPTNNIIHQVIPYEEMLIDENILVRPRVEFKSWSSWDTKDLMIESQTIVANELINKDKEFEWTLHQIGEKIILGMEKVKKFNSLRVEIAGCLPVPKESTPIEDILNFKKNRNSELLQLHETLDDFYLDILSSPDRDFQQIKSLNKLNIAISNLNNVSNEKFSFSSKYNLITELNINAGKIYAGVMAGDFFGNLINSQIAPITSIIGAIVSIINFKANTTTSVEGANDNLKLNFLAHAKNESII